MIKSSLLIFLLLLAASSEAVSVFERLKQQGALSYWLRLLHYEQIGDDRYKSRADGNLFFLHPNGKDNPEMELIADLAAFSNPQYGGVGFFGHHPQCVFPERFRFLKELGFLEGVKVETCGEFLEWKSAIKAASITLVFSTAYPNSPASLFGHTFIRFNRPENNPALLNYGAAYGAIVESDDSAFLYAYRGIFGGYKGIFTISPYYQLVEQYNNGESRDLIEYHLSMPSDRVERVVNHLWELYSSTYFDYWFFSENCSEVLARILELGMPEWNLSKVNRGYYLPADLEKKVMLIPDAVTGVTFRPALAKQFRAELENLSGRQQEVFHQLRSGKLSVLEVRDTFVLDAFISYKNFIKYDRKNISMKEDAVYKELLIHRSTLPTPAAVMKENPRFSSDASNVRNRPEISHDPRRMSVGSIIKKDGNWVQLKYDWGYHELLADDQGIEPFSDFTFLGLGFNVGGKDKIKYRLDHFTLININSYHPFTFYNPEFSWGAGGGIAPSYDLGYEVKKLEVHFHGGLSALTFSNQLLSYLFLGISSEYAKAYQKKYRLGPYLEGSMVFHPFRGSYKLQLKEHLAWAWIADGGSGQTLESIIAGIYTFKKNLEIKHQTSLISRFGSWANSYYRHQVMLGYYY